MSLIKALASEVLSFIPLSMTYSKVILLELLTPGYSRHALRSSFIGYLLFIGTRISLTSSVTACNEIAKLTSVSSPHLLNSGTIPEVESVILLSK